MNDFDDLVENVRRAATAPGRATTDGHSRDVAFPPLALEELQRGESSLGFVIPGLLRRLYLDVGNGGFGPGYGLLPFVPSAAVREGRFATTLYRQFHGTGARAWKDAVLPLSSWGSGVLSCLDLSSASADPQVYRYEPNMPGDYTPRYLRGLPFVGPGLIPEQRTLSEWLMEWLDGHAEEMFERMNQI